MRGSAAQERRCNIDLLRFVAVDWIMEKSTSHIPILRREKQV